MIVNAPDGDDGRKEEQKLYRYHSGYEGGLREERAKDVRAKNPSGWWKKP